MNKIRLSEKWKMTKTGKWTKCERSGIYWSTNTRGFFEQGVLCDKYDNCIQAIVQDLNPLGLRTGKMIIEITPVKIEYNRTSRKIWEKGDITRTEATYMICI